MVKDKKLVIVGIGETADIAYEYFTHDSSYEVIAFTVNQEFIENEFHNGLPIFALENLTERYSPKEIDTYVAISYIKLNRVRTNLFNLVKEMGYQCASYISSKAFVWHNVELGENVFIFENNVIQHKVKIGNNVILWSGNHIGHQTTIEDNVYFSSHCVVSGFCKIGNSSFIGVNSTFNDNITIAKDTVIGSAALIVKNIDEEGTLYVGAPAKKASKTSYEVFKVK